MLVLESDASRVKLSNVNWTRVDVLIKMLLWVNEMLLKYPKCSLWKFLNLNFTSGQEPYSTDCVIFTARRIASAVLATAVPSVRHTPVLCQNRRHVSDAFGNYLWPLYGMWQAIIFLPCGFFFYLSIFFIPRLISAVADWMDIQSATTEITRRYNSH